MSSQAPNYRGYRFPAEVISHAVWLYYRFTLSFRDVEDLLAQRSIIVTYETIRQWCLTFGLAYARTVRRRRRTTASRRALRHPQRRPTVSLARGGRGRRRARHPGAVAAQSTGGHTVLPQAVEKTRLRASPADHRQAPQLLGRASYRDAVRGPQYSAVRKQPSGGLASTDSSTRAADAPVQVGRPPATVRIGARRRPESVQGRPPPAPGSSPPSLESPLVPSLG